MRGSFKIYVQTLRSHWERPGGDTINPELFDFLCQYLTRFYPLTAYEPKYEDFALFDKLCSLIRDTNVWGYAYHT